LLTNKKEMQVKELDTRKQIYDEIINSGRKLRWVSNKTGINYNTLYSLLVHRRINLSDKNRKLLNDALKTDY
jgi:hypothetical protein